jgi:hypothetical protein
MNPSRPDLTIPRHPGRRVLSACGSWLVLWTGVLLTAGSAAGAPITAFALNDLNANSSRVGLTVSPRDYGQWISAYYFGNEG